MSIINNRENNSSFIVEYIKNRIFKKNKNFLCAFVGPTGSGKSYSALRLAEVLDPNFDVIHNVVFTASGFLSFINRGNFKKGEIVIFDEAGGNEGISSRNWQQFYNKAFNSIAQTFRKYQLIVLFTTPNITYIDKGTRMLLHGYFKTVDILRTKKLSKTKFYFIKNEGDWKDITTTYMRIYQEGSRKVIDPIYFKIPTKENREKYELLKEDFLKKHNRHLLDEAIEIDGFEAVTENDVISEDITKKVIETPFEEKMKEKKINPAMTFKQKIIYNLKKRGWTNEQIGNEVGVSAGTISSTLRRIRKKGYII